MKIHRSDKEIVYDIIRPDMETGPWIAGGAVMQWMKGQPVGQSDIDVFFRSKIQYLDVKSTLNTLNGCDMVYESDNADTFRIMRKQMTIQLIKRRFFDTAEDVINAFDLSVCQFITDGQTFLSGPDSISDLKSKQFSIVRPNEFIIKRVVKYMTYGYTPHPSVIEYLKEHKDEIKHTFPGSHEYEGAFI